jgi:hypothetical protein
VRIGGEPRISRPILAAKIAAVLAGPLSAAVLSPAWVLALIAAVAAGLVAFKTVRGREVTAGKAADTSQLSAHRQDVAHEGIDLQEDRQGGTTGTPEGSAQRSGL